MVLNSDALLVDVYTQHLIAVSQYIYALVNSVLIMLVMKVQSGKNCHFIVTGN